VAEPPTPHIPELRIPPLLSKTDPGERRSVCAMGLSVTTTVGLCVSSIYARTCILCRGVARSLQMAPATAAAKAALIPLDLAHTQCPKCRVWSRRPEHCPNCGAVKTGGCSTGERDMPAPGRKMNEQRCGSCHDIIAWQKSAGGRWTAVNPDGTAHRTTCPMPLQFKPRPARREQRGGGRMAIRMEGLALGTPDSEATG
jgi:hypothetical protein